MVPSGPIGTVNASVIYIELVGCSPKSAGTGRLIQVRFRGSVTDLCCSFENMKMYKKERDCLLAVSCLLSEKQKKNFDMNIFQDLDLFMKWI